jgi:SagB-type dehydrogenase family enzyme
VRSYAARLPSLDELSTLLHHAARTTHTVGDEDEFELAFHPYPTGGARSELEVYVVANRVEQLEPGAYWYDSRGHVLACASSEDADHRSHLQLWVRSACDLDQDVPVVLVITAAVRRTMSKYRGDSLHLIYKDCGCLLQALYLVATALDLAPCAVGRAPDLALDNWLRLSGRDEWPLALFAVGVQEAGVTARNT